jgi:hypothetical protein
VVGVKLYIECKKYIKEIQGRVVMYKIKFKHVLYNPKVTHPCCLFHINGHTQRHINRSVRQ